MGKFTALEKADLTKDWSIEEKSALGHFLTELKLGEKEGLFSTKSEGRVLYLIESGKVRLASDYAEVDLDEGESLGELSIIHGSPKLSGAITLTPCVFWILTLDKWEDMKKAAPVISLKLIERICEKMAKLLSHSYEPPKSLEQKPALASQVRSPNAF